MIEPRSCRLVAAVAAVLVMSGCAMQAPRYQPSLDNVELIKKTASPVALGALAKCPARAPSAPSRSACALSSMASPVGGDYAAYLADALRQELVLAGRLDASSKLEISRLLLKNDIAAGGISTNSGEIEARFIVKNAGQQRFDKIKRVESSWKSSSSVASPSRRRSSSTR